MSRAVTERDFRAPEFRNADPADYEFRSDGKIVRKDRWEKAIFRIAFGLDFCTREGFEIDDVVAAARELVDSSVDMAKQLAADEIWWTIKNSAVPFLFDNPFD
jgi:hypothetical protein